MGHASIAPTDTVPDSIHLRMTTTYATFVVDSEAAILEEAPLDHASVTPTNPVPVSVHFLTAATQDAFILSGIFGVASIGILLLQVSV